VTALLEIRGLTIELATAAGALPVVDGLELVLRAGETLALVGESGSGKTLTALALFGALPSGARVTRGEIRFRGRDLLTLAEEERRALLGRELALSFQEPARALDPIFTVGEQIAETLRHHAGLSRAAAERRTLELLEEVGLDDAARRARRLPSELSGGQRQRVMLALALALGPSLLVADEPTSALDTPLQAEILARLAALKAQREMALLLITHDLAVVAELAERVAVMYAGRIVEEAGVLELFERPSHPYTLALLRARPAVLAGGTPHAPLAGHVPPLDARPTGCRFHPRCALADERCRQDDPRLLPVPTAPASGPIVAERPELRPPDPTLALRAHRAACHHAGEGGAP
jgi:oligopeptide/dipeptide ABC transporter ATP-binding protein